MSLDRLPAHLADMLRFVRELRAVAQGQAVDVFCANRILCLAVEKLFINLGEAAYRMGDEGPQRWPGIAWRQVIGLRNILAHGYEQVAHEILWRTITDDLPALQQALEQALNSLPPPGA